MLLRLRRLRVNMWMVLRLRMNLRLVLRFRMNLRMVLRLRMGQVRLETVWLRGRLNLVMVWDGGLRAIRPCDLFGGPVFIVIINVCPVGLALGIVVLLKTCRNVDSIFLQFFVRELARFGRSDGFEKIARLAQRNI